MKRLTIVLATLVAFYQGIWAQEETENNQSNFDASVGADIVSAYVWRGQKLADVSVQPYLTIDWKSLSFEASGSMGFNSDDPREVNLTLGYNIGDFTVALTDYWTTYNYVRFDYFNFKKDETAHVLEINLAYDFDFLSINWYTNILGADGETSNGNRAFSSYLSLIAPFEFAKLNWEAELGICPWNTSYYEGAVGFDICDISITAYKDIVITDTFTIPMLGKLGFNLANKDAYFVVGISF